MDWDFSIERNRGMLLAHIVGLFAMIGLVEGGMVERVSRPLYRKVLAILRSAESAVRRLIIVMARDIKVEPRPKRPMPKGLIRSRKGTFQSKGHGKSGSAKAKAKAARPPSTCSTRKGAPIPARSSPPPAAQGPRAPHPCLRLRSADSGVPPALGLLRPHPRRSAAG